MATNSSGSSDRARIAQQRLKVIAGHLQKSESAISSSECKAQRSETDVSGEGKTVPRRRYEVLNVDGLKESNVFGFSYSLNQARCLRKRQASLHGQTDPLGFLGSNGGGGCIGLAS